MKRKIAVLIGVLCIYFCASSQNELTDNEILLSYSFATEQFLGFEDCGHIFDGPAFYMKQIENNSLDVLIDISEDDEIEIGKLVFEKSKSSCTILPNHRDLPKLKKILSKLSEFRERKKIDYQISVIDSAEVNAYSTIGGYIYVTTALLDFVDSDDELAFILGHEIAHVDQYHVARKYKKILLASAIGEKTGIQEFTKVALNLNLTLSAPFDQIDEYEADKYGALMAKKAGFDIHRFGDFFIKLQKQQKENILNKLLSTHPFAKDRKNCMESVLFN